MSPTARTLAYLRRRGAMVATVERWNSFAKCRVDLFGFADILAVDEKIGTLAVQATSGDHVAHRLVKMQGEKIAPKLWRWLAAGNRVQIFGWTKPSEGGRRKRWALRIVTVTAERDIAGYVTIAGQDVSDGPRDR